MTCYAQTLELLNMGIPALPIKFYSKWIGSKEKYKKYPSHLPSKDGNGFDISHMNVDDCKKFMEYKTKTEGDKHLATCNACIILCNNHSPVWALDFDEGYDKYEKLKITDTDDTVQQLTFNGSDKRRHYIFKKDDRITEETKFTSQEGISGDVKCGTGWIFASPSFDKHGKYEYTGKKFDKVDDFRIMTDEEWKWLKPKLKSSSVKQKPIEKKKEMHTDSDDEDEVDNKDGFVDLRKALSKLDINSVTPGDNQHLHKYEPFLKILMIIYNTTGGSKGGLLIAHKFCRRVYKEDYDSKEIDKKWSSFSSHKNIRKRGLTILTLYQMVNHNNPNEENEEEKLDLDLKHITNFDMGDEYNIADFDDDYNKKVLSDKKHIERCLKDLAKCVAYIDKNGGYYIIKKRKNILLKGKQEEENYYEFGIPPRITIYKKKKKISREGKPYYVEIPYSIDGKNQTNCLWTEFDDYLPRYMDTQFEPEGELKKTFNLWSGFYVETIIKKNNIDLSVLVENHYSLVMKHLEEVICSGDKNAVIRHLDWLSTIIQNPGNKTKKAILYLDPDFGAGKGTWTEFILYHLIGKIHGRSFKSLDHLAGSFNPLASHCLFGELPEVPMAKSEFYKMNDILKDLITGDNIYINDKNEKVRPESNHINLMCSTNPEIGRTPVPITEGDRRWDVYEVSSHRKGDTEYFNAIHKQMANPLCVCHFYKFLKERTITQDISHSPPYMTTAREKLLEISKGLFTLFIQEFTCGLARKLYNDIIDEVELVDNDKKGKGRPSKIKLITMSKAQARFKVNRLLHEGWTPSEPKEGDDLYTNYKNAENYADMIWNTAHYMIIRGEKTLMNFYRQWLKRSGKHEFNITTFKQAVTKMNITDRDRTGNYYNLQKILPKCHENPELDNDGFIPEMPITPRQKYTEEMKKHREQQLQSDYQQFLFNSSDEE